MLKKNHLHPIDNLFATNEEKNITLKNFLEEICYLKNDIARQAKIFL